MFSLLLAIACSSDSPSDSANADDDCVSYPEDDSGPGNELLGFWTIGFAQYYFDENCGLSDFDQTSETWLINATMEVRGIIPDEFYADINGEQFWGAMSPGGGVIFQGIHDSQHGDLDVSFGGRLYHEAIRYDRDYIDGFAFLGLDTIGDGYIDCGGKGDLYAIKSD